MPLPRTLTLVRHGESESNAAKRAAERGKAHPREADLMKVHTSERRLTERGVKQAQKAGEWLRAHFAREAVRRGGKSYDQVRGFVSPYVRAMETAGNLDLPVNWRADARLTERNWGDLDQLTYEERVAKYGSTENRELHGIFWPAGNGETLQMLSTRMWQHFQMLAREHQEHDVVEVSHGETILTQRFMLERWLPQDMVQMMIATDTNLSRRLLGKETDFQNKVLNCRIIQYTREKEDGAWDDKYCRVRLIAPSEPDDPKKNLGWQPIVRRQFNSEDLLAYVSQFPHFLRNAA
jgi:broad specificity phosphatase PhoE